MSSWITYCRYGNETKNESVQDGAYRLPPVSSVLLDEGSWTGAGRGCPTSIRPLVPLPLPPRAKCSWNGWGTMLRRAVLGPGPRRSTSPQDDVTPQCLERAVVVRQAGARTAADEECSVEAQEIRRVARAYCK